MDPEQPESFPQQSSDPQQEYIAARTGAAIFDLPHWTHIELAGSDRAKFLHNFCTNDIRGLGHGKGCEAFITNIQGKVLAHVFVYARAMTLEIIAVPGCAEPIIKHLSRYQINEDVTFTDRTNERGLLHMSGPQSAIALFNFGCGALSLASGENCDCSIGTFRITVCRNDLLRSRGFFLVCPAAQTAELSNALSEMTGAVNSSDAVFNVLRVEAAFPLYGVDITDANLAQEVDRSAQTISFSKGCYLGQEPIARIDALGHVNQQLRGIRLLEGPVPPVGAEVVTADSEARKIGQVTSAALAIETNLPVALGYLKRNFDTPGLAVCVVVDEHKIPAEIFWPAV